MIRFFLFTFFVSLASPVFAEDVKLLGSRMERLEEELSALQREIYQKGTVPSTHTTTGRAQAGIEASRLDQPIDNTQGSMEELAHELSRLQQQMNKLSKDMEFRFTELEKKAATTAETEKEAVKEAPKTTSFKDASTHYEAAFSLLREQKHEEAEKQFKAFIDRYPKSDYISNAYYWLGETYYARSLYKQASVYFLKGYQDYPKVDKRADHLLKLSFSLSKLGKKEEACVSLAKLLSEFKNLNKDIKSKAIAEQKVLGCM